MIQIMVNRHTRKTTGPILFFTGSYIILQAFSVLSLRFIRKSIPLPDQKCF